MNGFICLYDTRLCIVDCDLLSTFTLLTFDVPFTCLKLYGNNLYGVQVCNNRAHISHFKISSDDINEISKYSYPTANISELLVGEDEVETPHLYFINNDENEMVAVPIGRDGKLDYDSMHNIIIDNINGAIDHILQQDKFFYFVSKNVNEQATHIHIFTPQLQYFGTKTLPFLIQAPVLIGMHLHYLHKDGIMKFNMVDGKISVVLPQNLDTPFLSYCIRDDMNISWGSRQKIVVSDEMTIELNLQDFTIQSMMHSSFGRDYSHSLSPLLKSYVHTVFHTNMIESFKSLTLIIAELAAMIYTSPDACKKIADSMNLTRTWPMFHDKELNIYMGTTNHDILYPPHYMFANSYNYQMSLKEMGALVDDSPIKNQITIRKEVKHFLKQKGAFILPDRTLSGLLHCTWPHHGKGWHHNIESVPYDKVDVTYLSFTDDNRYGGSFFFYRHPVSHALHAVPDIHGTQKQFFLLSSRKTPLWHALCSFTAHRLSYGLSKRADMEMAEPNMFYTF